MPETGDYSRLPEEYRKLTGDQINIAEVTTNRDAALQRLRQRDVDIVVQVPQDIGATISSGSQVALPVYLNEVDPLRRDAITYLTYFYANEINKQTVAAAAGQGQEGAGDVRSAIVRMRNALTAIEQHMARGEVQEANRQVRDLQGSSANTQLAVALMAQFIEADTTIVKPAQPQDPNQVNLANGQQVANRVAGDIQALNDETEQAATRPGANTYQHSPHPR